jgi:hypothetical protein
MGLGAEPNPVNCEHLEGTLNICYLHGVLNHEHFPDARRNRANGMPDGEDSSFISDVPAIRDWSSGSIRLLDVAETLRIRLSQMS